VPASFVLQKDNIQGFFSEKYGKNIQKVALLPKFAPK
jgi:hypothetical protein